MRRNVRMKKGIQDSRPDNNFDERKAFIDFFCIIGIKHYGAGEPFPYGEDNGVQSAYAIVTKTTQLSNRNVNVFSI